MVVVVDELLVGVVDVVEVLDDGRELDVDPTLFTGADSVTKAVESVSALVDAVIQIRDRVAASSSSPDEHATPMNTSAPPVARSRTTRCTRGGTGENTSAL